MSRYGMRFCAVMFLLVFFGRHASAQDLVPVLINNPAGVSQSVVDAGFPREVTQHLQTADGRHKLSPSDNRCLSAGTRLYLPIAVVKEGSSARNTATYRTFIAEENRILGPPGSKKNCAAKATKYRDAPSLEKVLVESLRKVESEAGELQSKLVAAVAERDAERAARNLLSQKTRRLTIMFWAVVLMLVLAVIFVAVLLVKIRRLDNQPVWPSNRASI